MQKKSYGIARVSTGKQVKYGVSLDTQVKAINILARNNEEEIEHIFIDEGVSGSETTKRVEYTKLKELIKAGVVKSLYCYHMFRYGRNLPELMSFWNLCEKKEVMIYHSMDHFDYRGAIGKLIRTIMGATGEFIKDQASESTSSNLQSMKHGKRKYSITPYGYRVINERKDEEGKLVYKGDLELCPTESEVVKGMISALAGGISLSRIADGLNQRGIKPRRGKQWAHSQVASVISTFTSLQEK
jgi:DNA invertase Pin-like site-specific DNA recombinase